MNGSSERERHSSRYDDRTVRDDRSSRYSDRERHRSRRDDERASNHPREPERHRPSREDDDRRRSRRDDERYSSRREEQRPPRDPRMDEIRNNGANGRDWDRGRGSSGAPPNPPAGPGRMDDYGNRRRSRSPGTRGRPAEPTPDLEAVVPINERKRRMTMWDIKPQGYEAVSAEQAKMSGLFPLPGAPRTAQADPEKLKAFAEKGPLVLNPPALQPTMARQSRRVVVNNIPPLTEESTLVQYFNDIMYNLNIGTEGKAPCVGAQINKEKAYAMVEFRTSEEATCAMGFDGITYNERALEIRRPKDYIVPEAKDDEEVVTSEDGVISSIVPDSPNKIVIRGLPVALTDEQIIELLKSFGELKSFMLVKDQSSGESKGFAFCEFLDSAVTDIATEGLNGMELGDDILSVARASIGSTQDKAAGTGLQAISALAESKRDILPSRVLVMFNMVTSEELNDDAEYGEILEDVKDECARFGKVVDLKIPRPSGGSRINPGVGKVFVRFEDEEGCAKALKTLAGRKFADRTVLTSLYPEVCFLSYTVAPY